MNFDEDSIIECVNRAWGWKIPRVQRVLAVNSMGNVFLQDSQGAYWRICPEELYARIEAKNDTEVQQVFADPGYKADWQLLGLIDEAEATFGVLSSGSCYALVKPAVLGGDYAVSNMAVVSVHEYLVWAGNLAQSTEGLKDGDEITVFVPFKGSIVQQSEERLTRRCS